MKKKRYAERVNSIFSITNVASLFVTILKAKVTDAARCIAIVVMKDGRAGNDRIRKENRQDQGNH